MGVFLEEDTVNFDNFDNTVGFSIFLFIVSAIVIHFLVSIVVQILTWIDDGEGKLFEGRTFLGIDLGQLSADDAHYDRKSKSFLMPWMILEKSEINNGESRAKDWVFYIVIFWIVGTILAAFISYFWKLSLLVTAAICIALLSRRIVRLTKQACKCSENAKG